MKNRSVLAFVLLWSIVVVQGQEKAFRLPPSKAPFVYIIDYSGKHVDNEPWFESAAHCRPDLLHLGKDVPFTHNWGPIAGWGGENQWCGNTPDDRAAYQRRLSPVELKEKIAKIKAMVDRLHAAGVGKVMPYVCAMTIAGDWERRTGLWALYDHWGEYAEFGLGPRPAEDPKDWLVRKADGALFGYYASPETMYPPYGTERRCAACLNHPAWRQYMKAVMEWTARCGYDGVFPDNSCMFLCECERCQTMFREYLGSRCDAADRERLFGSANLDAIKLSTEDGTLLCAETKRFWCAGIADFMEHLRKSGQAIRPGFEVFPNAGAARWVEHAVHDCDLVMYELHGKHGIGSHPGVVRRNIVEDIAIERCINNEFEHKFARAVGTRVRAVGLAMGGTEINALKTLDSSWLPLAEACAYGGGGSASGLRMTTDPAQSAPVLAYRDFLHKWRDLYEGYRPCAQIGISAFSDQDFYERLGWLSHSRHLVCTRELSTQLADDHLLTDFIVRRAFTPEHLGQYKAVVLCKAECLDQPEIDAARAYAEQGGVLLLVGDNGLCTYRVEKREQRPFVDLENGEPLAGCSDARMKAFGKGKVVFFAKAPEKDQLAKAFQAACPGEAPVLCGENSTQRSRVHIEAMIRREGDSPRMVVHAINYNTILGKNAPPTEDIEGLRLSIPVPEGMKVKSAWSVSPERIERMDIAFSQDKEKVDWEMPPFKFYRAAAIDLEKR